MILGLPSTTNRPGMEQYCVHHPPRKAWDSNGAVIRPDYPPTTPLPPPPPPPLYTHHHHHPFTPTTTTALHPPPPPLLYTHHHHHPFTPTTTTTLLHPPPPPPFTPTSRWNLKSSNTRRTVYVLFQITSLCDPDSPGICRVSGTHYHRHRTLNTLSMPT